LTGGGLTADGAVSANSLGANELCALSADFGTIAASSMTLYAAGVVRLRKQEMRCARKTGAPDSYFHTFLSPTRLLVFCRPLRGRQGATAAAREDKNRGGV